MTSNALAPADLEEAELYKLDDAINWLVRFVNRQLEYYSHSLMAGREARVQFGFADFVHSYEYVSYWRMHCGDIADIFRDQGWDVTEYPYHEPSYSSSEGQPSLGFRTAL